MGKMLLDDKVFEDFEKALMNTLGVELIKKPSKTEDIQSYLKGKYNLK